MCAPNDGPITLLSKPTAMSIHSHMDYDDGSHADSGTCALCARSVSALTVHHLIPKTRHKNKRNKRTFDRQEVKQRVCLLCRPCHNHIHALFTEKELERSYNTIELLILDNEVQRFVQWIANKPDGFRVPSRQSNAKSARKRRQRS